MILKKYYNLFFLTFIFLFKFSLFISDGLAKNNSPTCEITNTNINCLNIRLNEVMRIDLLSEPYRIQIKFENKLIIKKNKINNSHLVKRVRVNKFSKSNTKLVIEFNNPTIISDIKYYKINNQSINLSMYFSGPSKFITISKSIPNKLK